MAMDAVELPYPVDVAVAAPVCKLMGSDGFARAAVGTTVKEPEHRDFDRPVTVASPSIGRFSAIHGDKDVSGAVRSSELLVEDKSAATGCSRHNDMLPSFKMEDMSPKPLTGCTKLFQFPRGEQRQLQFKAGRVSRSNGRSQSGKQRNIGSKCGDKRNFKVPLKIKNDYFPVKGGSSMSNSWTAGRTALGLYGLKSDNHEVNKLVDDLSLNEILDGSFDCPILGKEKGKKAINANGPIIHSVRKVCSMLWPVKSSRSQNISDLDDNLGDKKVCSSLLSSASLEERGIDGDCGDPSTEELASSNEDSYRKSEVTPMHPLDKPLYPPMDLFKKLALPPPKDLDSLLDAANPISSSKNTPDLRLGKQILARRGGLQPFPWSHAFNGHSRTNSDSSKVHAGKAICPGKGVRMMNPAALFSSPSDGFTDLDSITYDQLLVPCAKIEIVASKSKNAARSVPYRELGLSSSAASSFASEAPLECREESEHQQQGNRLSSLIAAAQTLCEIATSSPKKSVDKTKWPKKQPSQKAMKARKLKLGNSDHEELLICPSRPNSLLTDPEKIWPSKKPKLSMVERCFAKAPMNWATSPLRRSSPGRLVRESISETKLSIVNITKARKLMLPDFKEAREGLQ